MKIFTSIKCFGIGLASCYLITTFKDSDSRVEKDNFDIEIEEVQLGESPSIVVCISDDSGDHIQHSDFTINHASDLYSKLAFTGGGEIAFLKIQTYGDRQEVVLYQIPSFDTLSVEGANIFQRKNIVVKNKALKEEFKASRQKWIASLDTSIFTKKIEQFSDMKPPLELSKDIFNSDNYKLWNKHLLLISNCVNDLPPKHGHDRLGVINFTKGVNIKIVRPKSEKYINEFLAGDMKYKVYPNIDLAIKSVN